MTARRRPATSSIAVGLAFDRDDPVLEAIPVGFAVALVDDNTHPSLGYANYMGWVLLDDDDRWVRNLTDDERDLLQPRLERFRTVTGRYIQFGRIVR